MYNHKTSNNMNKYILAMLCTGLMTVSCTDSFEEVNKDPDKPLAEEVPSTNIMAYSCSH